MNVLFTYPQQLHRKEQALALQPELADTGPAEWQDLQPNGSRSSGPLRWLRWACRVSANGWGSKAMRS